MIFKEIQELKNQLLYNQEIFKLWMPFWTVGLKNLGKPVSGMCP